MLTFRTPTKMSLLDVMSMGDSSKRGDSSTIGQFDSGLKYAIALLLRANVTIEIRTEDDFFEFSTRFETYGDGKEKELIIVHSEKHGEIVTGFAKNLGYNWELYMAFRELYSNMLDENGTYFEGQEDYQGFGTEIYLTFSEDNEFKTIIDNKHLYVNEEVPLFKVSKRLEILRNEEQYIRIYKNNILVFEDLGIPSIYAYNISFGEIDERRILSNLWSVKHDIASEIVTTTNEDFLKTIISDKDLSKDFMSGADSYYTVSDLIIKIASSTENFKTFNWLNTLILKDERVEIVGKRFNPETIWRPTAILESVPVREEKELYFRDEILEMYNFDIENIEIKRAKLKGNKCISDKYNECIIVDEEFILEKDFHLLIVEYFTYKNGSHNLIEKLSKELVEHVKKF